VESDSTLKFALGRHRAEIEAGETVELVIDGRRIVVAPDELLDRVKAELADDCLPPGTAERRRRERRAMRPGDHRVLESDRRTASALAISRSEAVSMLDEAP
jgi:hypothetical protein